nr:unnamed protein product [Digitaria exilis]
MVGIAREAGAYLCYLLVFTAIFSIEKKLGNGDPSITCCEYVRNANVEEICEAFTEADKAKIALWKWVKVTRKCGNALATGHDCAGYVVQPPMS